jgi:hypothetical protein
MKLSDFITDIGRPIAFYPGLKKITKSTTATILLCQFIYWIGKGEAKDGSVYKTSKELEDETGLTYEEQKTARARLKEIGLLTEKYARLDHTVYFKIDTNKLDALWASSQCHDGEQAIDTMANTALTDSLNSNTETTSKNTTEIILPAKNAGKPEPIRVPCDGDGIPDDWKDKPKRKEKHQPDPRYTHIAYSAFYSVTKKRPASILVDEVIKIVGDNPDIEHLRKCYIEWCSRGYNPTSIKWLDWYTNGIPGYSKNNKTVADATKDEPEIDYKLMRKQIEEERKARENDSR